MTQPLPKLAKGQRWCAYPKAPPTQRIFVEVLRVARDGSWADILCCTWASAWRKRQPLRRGLLPFPAEPFNWDRSDLSMQEMDWERERRQEAKPA